MSKLDFEKQRARSRVYEMALSLYLQERRDWFILPVYDYSGLANDKAPRLVCCREWLVLPDLQGFHREQGQKWFEVKVKDHADFNNLRQRDVTGIATRHLHDYQRVKALTKAEVWLVFVHEREGVVVTGEIDAARISHKYDGGKMDRGGTTFFVFDQLTELMPLDELNQYIREPASAGF